MAPVRSTSIAMAILLALVTGGCGLHRSGYQFVRSPQTGTYLKVPADWQVYGKPEIKRYLAKTAPEVSIDGLPFISTFDGSDHPSVGFDLGGDEPAGIVRVRPLQPEERDATSFASLRSEVFDLGGNDGSQITPLKVEDVQHGGVRGQRVVFTRVDPLFGSSVTLDQTTLVDKTTSTLYLLVVGCAPDCFERNKKQIDTIVTSLTIKER